jgi:hypothetical protein
MKMISRNEQFKKISIKEMKTLEKKISELRSSIKQSVDFTEKIKIKNSLLSQANVYEKSTIHTSAAITQQSEKFKKTSFYSIRKNNNNFNPPKIKEYEFIDSYLTLPTQIVSTNENQSPTLKNTMSFQQFSIASPNKTFRRTFHKTKCEPIQSQNYNDVNKNNSNINLHTMKSERKGPDQESKLIISKVFNRKYRGLKNQELKEKEVKEVDPKQKLQFKYENNMTTVKAKMIFIKEVYEYAFPKIMLKKMKLITNDGNDSKIMPTPKLEKPKNVKKPFLFTPIVNLRLNRMKKEYNL